MKETTHVLLINKKFKDGKLQLRAQAGKCSEGCLLGEESKCASQGQSSIDNVE
jgi:hypothetical protein